MAETVFARNLKFLMQKQNLSPETLSTHMRTSESTVFHWLSGRNFPKRESLIDLCNALDYYDLYKMLTVDLRRQKASETRPGLPLSVSCALQSIKNTLDGLLVN